MSPSEIVSFGGRGGGGGKNPFIGRAYEETLGLLMSARHYCSAVQPGERLQDERTDRIHLNCEAMRLTTRLAQVMAWLLAQRAVDVGELSPTQARSPKYRLGAHEICLVDTTERARALSPKLGDLMARSLELFERVARLDAEFDRVH
jgi:regulator of CtrA degradation